MYTKIVLFALLFLPLCAWHNASQIKEPLTPKEISTLKNQPNFYQQGMASFYAKRFQNQLTASGETYDTLSFTAAHRSLPFGTKMKVVNIATGKEVVVKINDRGPFHPKRVIDLSNVAAKQIGLSPAQGITEVLLLRVSN